MKQTTYNTKQKTAILQGIKMLDNKHFTVDSLCDLMLENGKIVGRTTVYRFLEKLAGDGILRKYAASQGESVCYQYIADSNNCNEHFHLKCERCGSLIHMECREMDDIVCHIKSHHGFLINPLKTVIYGICEDCAVK